MSSLRIPTSLARLLRLPTGGEGASRTHLQGPQAPQLRRGAGDGFRAQQPASGHPPLRGEERGPVKAVKDLVPPGLEKTAGREALALRFASDAALLAMQLTPSQLSGSERATRLWEFYAAYATAAAAQPQEAEAHEAFREALESQGFAELRDTHTGENGVARGLWVASAGNPDEARERAQAVRLEPPPEVRHSEDAARAAEGALALPPGARAMDAARGVAVPVALEPREPGEQPVEDLRKRRGTDRRLGPMLLWNVLHRFRSDPEDGAVAQGQWDRLAFGALLALVGIALLVLALVSL